MVRACILALPETGFLPSATIFVEVIISVIRQTTYLPSTKNTTLDKEGALGKQPLRREPLSETLGKD